MRAPRRLFPLPGLTLLTLVLLLLSGAQQVFAQPAGGDNTPAADDSANAQTSPSVGAAPDNTPPLTPDETARLRALLTLVAGGGTQPPAAHADTAAPAAGAGTGVAAAPAAYQPKFYDKLIEPISAEIGEWYLYFNGTEGHNAWWVTILIGFGLLFCGFLLGLIVITVIHPLLTRLAKMTKNEQDDLLIGAIKYPLEKFFQVVGVSIAAYWWAWPIHQGDPTNLVYAIIVQFFFVCMWLVAGAFLWKFADFIVGILTEIAQSTETKFDDQLVQPIKSTLRASVAIFVGLMLIQSVGWDIGAILAGLGLGGIAFALAGQETIKNLFGSITVFADRPFRIGDTIAVGDVKGTVESIGFRSTRVRTWDQTEVTMPNKQFTDSRVENLTRRKVRRFTANFGCTYDTTREQMTLLVDGIRVLLNKIDAVDKESITVYFTEFGESSINLLVRASITELNYAKYMSIVQDLNFAIWALYDELGVAMAFPTRTLEFGTSAIDALSALGGKGATKAAAATKSTTTKAAAKKKTTPASKKKGGRSAGAKVAARAEGASLKTSDRTDADLDLTD